VEYDFLGVGDDWKLQWTRTTRAHRWVYVFPPKWRARLLHAAKFRLIPELQRWPVYGTVRDAMLGRSRHKAG
jgi:hypothetical protein